MLEIILEVGAEGGSITLFGSRDRNDKWLFSLHAFDCSDEEKEAQPEANKDSNSSSTSKPSLTSSWSEALSLLNYYASWHYLYPLILHHEFESYILDEVRKRGGIEELERWRRILKRRAI